MRIGVIGRADPTGLGSMTVDFCRNVAVDCAIIVRRDNRGATDSSQISGCYIREVSEIDAKYTVDTLQDFGCDVLVGFETFYSHDIVPECARHGIKTVMFPMWECSPPELAACDLLVAVTDTDKKRFPNAVRMDWPMEAFFSTAGVPPINFVCNGGSLGLNNRNNFDAAVKAVWKRALDNTNARLIISCRDVNYATELAGKHPCIGVRVPAKNRSAMYSDADVIIHLQAFDGLSLPQLEAAASGIPMIVMDIKGNEQHPHKTKVSHTDHHNIMGQCVPYARPDIEDLARMLRGMATGEIPLQSSPKPPTWAEFKEGFHGALSTLCRSAA